MTICETAIQNRDGVFTRLDLAQDFKLRRRCRLWKDWYWIDTPNGINCANAQELSWDDELKRKGKL